MIVSESARVLFVHVQKTGGTSIESLILDNVADARRDMSLRGDKHSTLPTILRARPEYEDFFIFGFVRNPWARMLSWHLMVRRRAMHPERLERHPFWRGVAAGYPDFESFVMRAPDEFSRLRRPQLDYLRFRDRRADFIGRTESMGYDVAAIAERLELPEQPVVPHINRGKPREYQEHYTPAMRDRVAGMFAVDIAEFGYTFD